MRDEWIRQTESHGSICLVNMLTNEREYYFLTYEDVKRLPTNDQTSYKPFYYRYTDENRTFSELTWKEPKKVFENEETLYNRHL
jgi:hypothetical protein